MYQSVAQPVKANAAAATNKERVSAIGEESVRGSCWFYALTVQGQ
jgi:hypothetical protein